MKKFFVIIASVIATVVIAGPPHSDNITNVSTKVIPEQGLHDSGTFQWIGTNAYSQGFVVKNSGNYYMATIAGTSTNLAPIHSVGTADTERDGVTWRAFDPRRRNGLALVNTGTNAVSISLGYEAVGGKGIVLNANGGAFSLDNDLFQGPVYAEMAVDNTNSLTSITW